MRTALLVPMAMAAGAAFAPASAQITVRTAPRAYAYSINTDNSPRAVIGVTMSTGDAQDTLGIRISEVAADSPAEKAGIVEGDRLQAINGVNLRLSSIDIGDNEMADAMSRRLTRELGKLKPGDEVSLRVYHDGQTKTVSLKTVDSDDLYGNPVGAIMRKADNRAVLGVSLAVTGSKRDTLGVLIVGVTDDGPAAKAGLEEGNRIASINGVDLKVDRADAGDSYVSGARYERLQKEMGKVKPGDDVSLQVYADGHFKTVHVKAEKGSDLTGGMNTFIFNGNGGQSLDFQVDGQQVREQVQRAMDQVRESMQRLRDNPRLRWMDDNGMPEQIDMPPMPPMPPAPAMAPTVYVSPRAMVIRADRAAPAPAAMPALAAVARDMPAPAAVPLRAALAVPRTRIIRF